MKLINDMLKVTSDYYATEVKPDGNLKGHRATCVELDKGDLVTMAKMSDVQRQDLINTLLMVML
jgi:hypothetical protein